MSVKNNMDLEEEIAMLKKENEKLKDGENTAKMIDKLNDEFSVLQDKNMKLEEQLEKEKQNCAFLSIRVQSLDEENKKLNKEIDEMFEATDYGDDIIRDGYTKLDAIYEWATSACDGFKEENEKLEEEIKELKKEKDCADKELKTLEELLRIFSKDNKLPEEGLSCHGCRIRQIGGFIAFTMERYCNDANKPVVQATPVN